MLNSRGRYSIRKPRPVQLLTIVTSMLDFIYILGTVAFFALMLLYVRACERLGRDITDRSENTP